MRIRATALLAIFAALSMPVCAQPAQDVEHTGGYVNGRYWNEMTKADRVWFVIGFNEGAIGVGEKSKEYLCNCTYGI